MHKALDILGALGRDRLRVMFEVRAKGWVVWWFWRLRGWCEIGKMTYELSDLWEIDLRIICHRIRGVVERWFWR